MQAFRKASQDSEHYGQQSYAMNKVRATYRVTEATELFCWISFVAEILLLFILPTIGLFTTKNYNVAWVFFFAAVVTALRRFFSSAVCLQELGSLEGMEKKNSNQTSECEEWRKKHRLGKIVGKISHGKRRRFWIGSFLLFLTAFFLIFVAALNSGGGEEGREEPLGEKVVKGFEYKGDLNMKYPTCNIGKQFQVGKEDSSSSMADYVYLALAAYQKPVNTQNALDVWFGDGVAIDDKEVVQDFRKEYQDKHGASAVVYKLFKFDQNNTAVISIRGTHNNWDALTDAQLWGSAALAQFVRAAIPFGDVWTPIFEVIVKAVSVIESSRLEDVSYCKYRFLYVHCIQFNMCSSH